MLMLMLMLMVRGHSESACRIRRTSIGSLISETEERRHDRILGPRPLEGRAAVTGAVTVAVAVAVTVAVAVIVI